MKLHWTHAPEGAYGFTSTTDDEPSVRVLREYVVELRNADEDTICDSSDKVIDEYDEAVEYASYLLREYMDLPGTSIADHDLDVHLGQFVETWPNSRWSAPVLSYDGSDVPNHADMPARAVIDEIYDASVTNGEHTIVDSLEEGIEWCEHEIER